MQLLPVIGRVSWGEPCRSKYPLAVECPTSPPFGQGSEWRAWYRNLLSWQRIQFEDGIMSMDFSFGRQTSRVSGYGGSWDVPSEWCVASDADTSLFDVWCGFVRGPPPPPKYPSRDPVDAVARRQAKVDKRRATKVEHQPRTEAQ